MFKRKKLLADFKDMLEAVLEAHEMEDKLKNADKDLEKKEAELVTKQKRLDGMALKKDEQQKEIDLMLENAKKEAMDIKTKISEEAHADKEKALKSARQATARKKKLENEIELLQETLADLEQAELKRKENLDAMRLQMKALMGELD